MYKIVGADQKEYGPITEEQLRQWITEGRANGQTIARFEDGPWKPLSTFPQFASMLGSSPPPVGSPPPLPLSSGGSNLPPNTNGLAIGGLCCSILGLFCCGPIFSTLGLILSAISLSQINDAPTRYTGKGVALAGIAIAILGYILFAILVFSGLLRQGLRHFQGHF